MHCSPKASLFPHPSDPDNKLLPQIPFSTWRGLVPFHACGERTYSTLKQEKRRVKHASVIILLPLSGELADSSRKSTVWALHALSDRLKTPFLTPTPSSRLLAYSGLRQIPGDPPVLDSTRRRAKQEHSPMLLPLAQP